MAYYDLVAMVAWRDPQSVPKAVGWELKGGKLSSRFISLAESMDPERFVSSIIIFYTSSPGFNITLK